jgi:hypothetical protein
MQAPGFLQSPRATARRAHRKPSSRNAQVAGKLRSIIIAPRSASLRRINPPLMRHLQ